MMEREELKTLLWELHDLSSLKTGENRVKRSGKDVEKILYIEKSILKFFALPATGYNLRLLNDFEKMPYVNKGIVEELFNALSRRAEAYLLGPILSDIEYLRKARREEADGYDTLKEMGFTAHVYTLFIYYDILLAGIDSAENVLYELNRVHQEGNLLKELKMAFLKGEGEKMLIEKIAKKNLMFFEKFMAFREQGFLLTQ